MLLANHGPLATWLCVVRTFVQQISMFHSLRLTEVEQCQIQAGLKQIKLQFHFCLLNFSLMNYNSYMTYMPLSYLQ